MAKCSAGVTFAGFCGGGGGIDLAYKKMIGFGWGCTFQI